MCNKKIPNTESLRDTLALSTKHVISLMRNGTGDSYKSSVFIQIQFGILVELNGLTIRKQVVGIWNFFQLVTNSLL